jgi:hypothetical protein
MRNEHSGKDDTPRPSQLSEQPQPRRRNVYDCDGEYEFLVAQHWTAPETDRADERNRGRALRSSGSSI